MSQGSAVHFTECFYSCLVCGFQLHSEHLLVLSPPEESSHHTVGFSHICQWQSGGQMVLSQGCSWSIKFFTCKYFIYTLTLGLPVFVPSAYTSCRSQKWRVQAAQVWNSPWGSRSRWGPSWQSSPGSLPVREERGTSGWVWRPAEWRRAGSRAYRAGSQSCAPGSGSDWCG